MDTTQAESINKMGDSETYTGVSINALLELAHPNPEASKLILVGADGDSIEVALADVQACADCILSFRSQGGFSTVMPGIPGSGQVKDVVEIKVE